MYLRLISFAIAVFLGFQIGKPKEIDFAIVEDKHFAVVVYAFKNAKTIEKTLRSIFEQDYENFRIILFDDNSKDETFEKVQSFVAENNQENKVTIFQNQQRLGRVACMNRAAITMQPEEIIIPIEGSDLFAHPDVLKSINGAYQNPDVWLTQSYPLMVPSFEVAREANPISFYAALFQEIRLADLINDGKFRMGKEAFLTPILQMSQGRQKTTEETLLLSSFSRTSLDQPYAPYPLFFKTEMDQRADIIVFSSDRPLQLFACLESIQRYISGFEEIYVLYKANDDQFFNGYQKLIALFPHIHFISQDCKKDFQPKLLQILKSCNPYVLFATDDDLVKDATNLDLCMEMMAKTKAYGFYLRLGKNITYCYQSKKEQYVPKSLDLGNGIFAWNIQIDDSDWGFPNTVDMTLYKKSTFLKAFEKMQYKTPNSLEYLWSKDYRPKSEIGLYFQTSKILNIPLNVLSKTGNPHMNYMTPLELLAKFEQGYKIDIDPLYKIKNDSPHFEYYPEFILR